MADEVNPRDGLMPARRETAGPRGFYYHVLDMTTGQRAWRCERSTVDTGSLLAGALTAAAYFDRDTPDEHQIRSLADPLYRRADGRWAQHGEATLTRDAVRVVLMSPSHLDRRRGANGSVMHT